MGLHILGQPLTGTLLVDGILQMLRLSNGDMPSIYDLFAEKYGVTLDDIQQHAGDMVEAQGITSGQLMDKIRKEAKTVIETLASGSFTAEAITSTMALQETQGGDAWRATLKKLLLFVKEEMVPRIQGAKEELTHTMDALAGRYVEPGPSGSPNAGGVSLLPSGRNFYGTDPRTMPSPTGWQLGVKLGDRMIEKFIADQGKYPENIGMVLWSGPNMRSSGQDIAEFLYLLGVRPVWQKGSLRVTGLEVIPLTELKRPRIDVTGRISGLFRDTLPQLAELMDKAVLLAASLDESEEDNFIRKHVREDARSMEDAGVDGDEAWRNAAFRISEMRPEPMAQVSILCLMRRTGRRKRIWQMFMSAGAGMSLAAENAAYSIRSCLRSAWLLSILRSRMRKTMRAIFSHLMITMRFMAG